MQKEFPPKYDLERLENFKKHKDIYDGELYKWVEKEVQHLKIDEKHKRILYIAVNFAGKISRYFSSLILGEDGFYYDVDDDTTQEKVNEIYSRNKMDIKVYQSCIDQSRFGYFFLRVRRNPKDNLSVIEHIPNDRITIEWEGSMENRIRKATLFSYVTLMDGNGKETKYLYKEIYYYPNNAIEAETVNIKYELWSLTKENKPDAQVPLSIYDASLQENVVTDIDFIPVFLVNNPTDSSNVFGKSDYIDLIPLFKELNERVSGVAKQLMKHMNSRIAVPRGTLDRDGKVKMSESELFEVGQDGTTPSYIVNANPQIDQAFKHIESILRYISAISQVPLESFGIDQKGGVESPEGFKLRLFETIQRVNSKRLFLYNPLIEVIKTALLLENVQDQKIDIVWSEPLPEDAEKKIKVLSLEVSSELKSKRTAIKELQELDEKQLEVEIARIEEDSNVNQPTGDGVTLPSQNNNVLLNQ